MNKAALLALLLAAACRATPVEEAKPFVLPTPIPVSATASPTATPTATVATPTPSPTAPPATPTDAPIPPPTQPGSTALQAEIPPEEPLPPWDQLGRAWGPYVMERAWGYAREGISGGWEAALDTAPRYQPDGIAGVSDARGDFGLSLALWDGASNDWLARFPGTSTPIWDTTEGIGLERSFAENTPSHSYMRARLRYGGYEVEVRYARREPTTLLAEVQATPIEGDPGPLHLLPLVWVWGGGTVEHLDPSGFRLAKGDRHVAVLLDGPAQSYQVVPFESRGMGGLDSTLTDSGALADGGQGNRGAFQVVVDPAPGAAARLRLALAEGERPGLALGRAQRGLAEFDAVLEQRRSEAEGLFRNVFEHGEVYRHALTNLLWNYMHYRYDGGAQEGWQGRVAADALIVSPDKWEFPWPAAWDMAFQAKALTVIDPALAQEQLRFLLSDAWQQPDGHIPDNDANLADENPPVIAWAVWEVYQASGDRAFLEEAFNRLERHYGYFLARYFAHNNKQNPNEIWPGGMESALRPPEHGFEQADLYAWRAFYARSMKHIAEGLGRADRAAYYDQQWWEWRFFVNEINWDEATGLYYDRYWRGPYLHPGYSSLVPIIAGVVPPERIGRVLEHLRNPAEFWTDWGVRSLSKASPLYRPDLHTDEAQNSNWRGPVWININYLLVQALQGYDPALAEQLRENLVRNIEAQWQASGGHFYEMYHGDSGAGLGADHFTGWTALVANLIAEKWGQ